MNHYNCLLQSKNYLNEDDEEEDDDDENAMVSSWVDKDYNRNSSTSKKQTKNNNSNSLYKTNLSHETLNSMNNDSGKSFNRKGFNKRGFSSSKNLIPDDEEDDLFNSLLTAGNRKSIVGRSASTNLVDSKTSNKDDDSDVGSKESLYASTIPKRRRFA